MSPFFLDCVQIYIQKTKTNIQYNSYQASIFINVLVTLKGTKLYHFFDLPQK